MSRLLAYNTVEGVVRNVADDSCVLYIEEIARGDSMSKDSTAGLSPQKLARLLGIALDSEPAKEKLAYNTAELLRARLDEALPDMMVMNDLPAILGRLRKDIMPLRGKSLGDLLTDPKSDINAIKKIKHYAKKTASRVRCEPDRAVAISIYYAAIASALIFHDVKLTTHSYKSLEESFAKLLKKPWITEELNRLFAKALKICRPGR